MRPLHKKLGHIGLWVEPAVGYIDSFLPHRIFYSFSWYHHTWGMQGQRQDGWRVIYFYPNPKDFLPVSEPRRDYLLFLGRVQKCKGVDIAIKATRIYNQQYGKDLPLVIAGPNIDKFKFPKGVVFSGYANPAIRLKLFQDAAAVFYPTRYCEPGGFVPVESQYCGTPVIASNFGGFTETVPQHAGVLCDTVEQFANAIPKALQLDRARISQHAKEKFDHDKIANQFLQTFDEFQSQPQ